MVPKRTAPVDATDMNLKLRRREILREDGELALGSSGLEGVDHEKQIDRLIYMGGRTETISR